MGGIGGYLYAGGEFIRNPYAAPRLAGIVIPCLTGFGRNCASCWGENACRGGFCACCDLRAQGIRRVAQSVADKQLGQAKGALELVVGLDSAQQVVVLVVQQVVDLGSTQDVFVEVAQQIASGEEMGVEVLVAFVASASMARHEGQVSFVIVVVVA